MKAPKGAKLVLRDRGKLSFLKAHHAAFTVLDERFDDRTFAVVIETPHIPRKKTKSSIPGHKRRKPQTANNNPKKARPLVQ